MGLVVVCLVIAIVLVWGLIAMGSSGPPDVEGLRLRAEQARAANEREESLERRQIELGMARQRNPVVVFNAASNGDLELLQTGVAAGFDVDATDDDGWTLLHFAAGDGQREVVEWLLAKGARRDRRASTGGTPADFARRRGHEDVARLLAG